MPTTRSVFSAMLLVRVFLGPEQVDRNIRRIAYHPTVVPRSNVEKVSSFQVNDASIAHCRHRVSRSYKADMLNFTKLLAHRFPNVFRPFPAELVSCATNRHTANVHQFKAALFESAHFIRCVEPFQDGVSGDHSDSSSATFTSRTRFLMYDRRFSRSI